MASKTGHMEAGEGRFDTGKCIRKRGSSGGVETQEITTRTIWQSWGGSVKDSIGHPVTRGGKEQKMKRGVKN